MSRARLPRHEVLTALTNELRRAGYQWREKAGGKHGKLIVSVNGREESIVVSTSPSDHRAGANALGWLRRRIRDWKAEAATINAEVAPQPIEEETVHHSTDLQRANDALVYHGQVIRSRDEMLSLTDMWRASGGDMSKRPVEWLRSKAARSFIEHLELMVGKSHLLEVGRGRDGKTFAHWQVGMAYAKYLSHDFHIWCNSVVRAHMEERPAPSNLPAEIVDHIRRTDGIVRMLAHKVTTTERSLAAIEAYLTDPHTDVVPALDLAGTVTSLMVIEMAGVPADQRVRGTSAVVTRHLKDFCLRNSFGAFPTPEHIDSDKRWRFPREAATEWLIGEARGAEIIRSHVARQRARLARKGQMALELVGSGR